MCLPPLAGFLVFSACDGKTISVAERIAICSLVSKVMQIDGSPNQILKYVERFYKNRIR